jgi:predicted nucleotidyltransferase
MGKELESSKVVALKRYLKEYQEIVVAYLFGSHARGEADARSDVDIAVLLHAGLPDAAHLELRLDAEICDILGSNEVDVLFLNDAPLPMQAEVIRTGQIIVSNDEDARIGYEVDAMNRWWDFQPIFEMHWRTFVQRTKESFSDEQRRAYEEARRAFARAHQAPLRNLRGHCAGMD